MVRFGFQQTHSKPPPRPYPVVKCGPVCCSANRNLSLIFDLRQKMLHMRVQPTIYPNIGIMNPTTTAISQCWTAELERICS